MHFRIKHPVTLSFRNAQGYYEAVHSMGTLEVVGDAVWLLKPLLSTDGYARERTITPVKTVLVLWARGDLVDDWKD